MLFLLRFREHFTKRGPFEINYYIVGKWQQLLWKDGELLVLMEKLFHLIVLFFFQLLFVKFKLLVFAGKFFYSNLLSSC